MPKRRSSAYHRSLSSIQKGQTLTLLPHNLSSQQRSRVEQMTCLFLGTCSHLEYRHPAMQMQSLC